MSDENKTRDAADAVKGILEAVPVYQDAIQPLAKEVGTTLQTAGQAINAALLPLKGLIWGFKKIERYLIKTMGEKLSDVPTDRIVTPNPAVAGPTLEALRFAAHEPSLRELYANLLATSMDAKTAREAHPAFVEVIRQLSADEARLIEYISSLQHHPFYIANGTMLPNFEGYEKKENDDESMFELDPSNTVAIAARCNYPELTESYLDNIKRLGLVHITGENFNMVSTPYSFALIKQSDVWDACVRQMKEVREKEKIYTVFFQGKIREIRFTAFGGQFCRACVYAPDSILQKMGV